MVHPPAQDSATPSALSDDQLVEHWLLAGGRSRRPGGETERAYRREVDRFRAWAGKPLRHVTYGDLTRFISHLVEETSLGPSSVARSLAALRSLFDFAIEQGVLRQENPTRMVSAPRHRQGAPPALLAPARLSGLIRDSVQLDLRQRLLLLCVVVLGCRGREAGALRWGDFVRDPAGRLGCVIGANGKDQRVLAVPAVLAHLLVSWREARSVSGDWSRDDRRYLFGSSGRRPLSDSAVRRLVARASRRLLGEAAPSVHLLRLSAAQLALLSGQEPAQLAADWDLAPETVSGLLRTTRQLRNSTPLWIWPESQLDQSAGI